MTTQRATRRGTDGAAAPDLMSAALHPDTASMMADMLCPPPGMALGSAVGTTFTLDPETAFVAALMASGRALGGDARRDANALVAQLREAGSRVAVFMEAGQLARGAARDEMSVLLAPMLREVLVPVRAGNKGAGGFRSFHPKVWVLHFVPSGTEDDDEAGGIVRLVVSSRNLSRSRSRDLAVTMEGRVTGEAVPESAPVAELLRSLPGMVVSQRHCDAREEGLSDEGVEGLAKRASHTRFVPPPGFALEGFALGGPARPANAWLPRPCERLAVVSPYLDAATLGAFGAASGAEDLRLASRCGALDALAARDASLVTGVDASWSAWAFEDAEGTDGEEQADEAADEPSNTLHAKLFVEEGEDGTRLTIGSANATEPARQGRNVEFSVVLRTAARAMPVPPLPDPSDSPPPGPALPAREGFATMLVPYERPAEAENDAPEDEEEGESELGRRTRLAAYELLDGCFALYFDPTTGSGWTTRLRCTAAPNWEAQALRGLRVRARIAASGPDDAAEVTGWGEGVSHDFAAVPVRELSPFVTFEIARADEGEGEGEGADGGASDGFTTQLPHEGFPAREHFGAVMRRRLPRATDWMAELLAALDLPGAEGDGEAFDAGGDDADGDGDATGDGMDRAAGPTEAAHTSVLTADTALLERLIERLDEPDALRAFARTLDALGEAAGGDETGGPETDCGETDGDDAKARDELGELHSALRAFWSPFEHFIPDGGRDGASDSGASANSTATSGGRGR